jgi:phosphoglycerol transferase MdoB-like AlkP superfamily enzyme
MPPAISILTSHVAGSRLVARHGFLPIAILASLHLAAIALMVTTEAELVPKIAFILTWGALNCLWVIVLRRPALAAALSLAMIVGLILLSRLKHDVLSMTVNFVDVMIIDLDTTAFLLTVFPDLQRNLIIAAVLALPLLLLTWRLDPFRIRARIAAASAAACLAPLAALSIVQPSEFYDEFFSHNYVSKFARSGVAAISELLAHGLMESDASVADRLKMASDTCQPAGKRPHIVMVLDESSFDITAAPGIKVPPDYQRHFQSFDGKQRAFMIEGVGGPTWFTEYNVLTGLSAHSYGRFAESVTRIAAGRVERGLPQALRRCGYKTFSLYPALGAFLGARGFQTSAGVERFLDARDMGTRALQPDRFYYDAATRLIARERGERPLFLFVYTAINHFPWNTVYRPDLTPDWQALGNKFEVDEYLRRQRISATDYAAFLDGLKREFPGESFLLVRFGDHQPEFGMHIVDPSADEATVARRIMAFDPRYYTTYYAIDVINFTPVELSSALDTLDAPYLPLVVQEAAGLPLDPSFAEQKRIFERCRGVFYRCGSGAEARRFNRLLIDAGLIKGL